MPHFHIAQSWGNDFDDIERRAAEGNGPRYGVPLMVRRLGAKLYQAVQCAPAVSFSDRLRSRLIGIPQTWSFVHDVAPRLGSNDVVTASTQRWAYRWLPQSVVSLGGQS